MRYFLLGFMGTGKTHWGRLWAEKHDMDFFDLDTEIEKEAGLTIPDIFLQFGETHFREKEREVLHSFGARNNFILSTGGGTPCFFDNMEWMNRQGLTIYLDTPAHILQQRLIKEKEHRPLIQKLDDQGITEFITDNIKRRNQFYSQSAIILHTETMSEATFNEIKQRNV